MKQHIKNIKNRHKRIKKKPYTLNYKIINLKNHKEKHTKQSFR